MDQPRSGDTRSPHHEHVSQTEHKILDHLTHHHSQAEIKRELDALRAEDKQNGHNFHQDLQHINKDLQAD